MIDTSKMKDFLMTQYMESGGENPLEFLRGMVWMESLLMDQVPKELDRLNDALPRDEQIRMLEWSNKKLREELETQKLEVGKLKKKLNNLSQSNGKVLKELAVNAEIKKLRDSYNEMLAKYLAATNQIKG